MNKTSVDIIRSIRKTFVKELQYSSVIIILIISALIFLTIRSLIRYPIAYWKSKREGLITQIPFIPSEVFRNFKEDKVWKKLLPGVRIQCKKTSRTKFLSNFAIRKVNKILKENYDLEPNDGDSYSTALIKRNPIPDDVRTISIRMEGFKHGRECYEFIPINGRHSRSHFTYQMFGDNRIQVTNYVEEGISYVAGVCIYIPKPQDWGIHYHCQVIKDCFQSREYPFIRSRNFQMGFESRELTVEYCHVSERTMLTSFQQEGVFHQEWNQIEENFDIEKCQKCTNRANRDRPPPYSSLTRSNQN
uniref:Amiloride-sensitive sodium channel n=1 Tax=Caenorhabditis tropicalis TaxID=1561998 RepID=A0A1I7UFA3_9PELO